MKEIREIFHDVVNDLNAICMPAAFTVEVVKLDNYEQLTDADKLKKHLHNTIQALEKTEESAIKAAKKIFELEKMVYKLLKIDKNKPLQESN